jgi:hypothetical protein
MILDVLILLEEESNSEISECTNNIIDEAYAASATSLDLGTRRIEVR